jgi:hypothetical protein
MLADAVFIIVCPVVGIWIVFILRRIANYLFEIVLYTQFAPLNRKKQ